MRSEWSRYAANLSRRELVDGFQNHSFPLGDFSAPSKTTANNRYVASLPRSPACCVQPRDYAHASCANVAQAIVARGFYELPLQRSDAARQVLFERSAGGGGVNDSRVACPPTTSARISRAPNSHRSINMATDIASFFDKWPAARQQVKQQAPEIARAFGGFYQATMKDGALSLREKELIALAIGLADRCTPCISLHVQGALKAGATREQILEAVGVAVVMQGGPAFTHVPEVLAALEHLETQSRN